MNAPKANKCHLGAIMSIKKHDLNKTNEKQYINNHKKKLDELFTLIKTILLAKVRPFVFGN